MYKFAPASRHEPIVFGSARPEYSNNQVNEWIRFMQTQNIQRVCCLLPKSQLRHYSDLLDVYQQTFGIDQVCWSPIQDFHFATHQTLIHQILPFLACADRLQEKAVVHCSAGIGRTGHVLAAWLVAGRGLTHKAAISAVQKSGRNPYESVIAAPFQGRNPWKVLKELNTLLDECNRLRGEWSNPKL
ncbi:protein-tyrosine phosphatase family protein [Leptothoe sp. PORK10 BA2]|uniref:protein-tyrosine phosphatase family protein n=1 Tax=Leptothoe sp. PORK10 BA2 TaxID=3110254 RepID=UPI002B212067|nr:dual specificity protein phosphatase family protein [Leptothoe sp. PORK10 BA2]MEA5466494.1 dual specificity protein phosphatase family protein [Leptothoe sp. PORK10 BA2]